MTIVEHKVERDGSMKVVIDISEEDILFEIIE